MTINTTDHDSTTIPDGVDMTDPYADDPAFALHQGGKLVIASRVPVFTTSWWNSLAKAISRLSLRALAGVIENAAA